MVTPLAGPAPRLPAAAAAAEQQPPTQNGRHLLGRRPGRSPRPPPEPPGRRGPAGAPSSSSSEAHSPSPPPPPTTTTPVTGTRVPPSSWGPKGTKGSRDEAAGSHFVVLVLGLGLVHPERGRTGWGAAVAAGGGGLRAADDGGRSSSRRRRRKEDGAASRPARAEPPLPRLAGWRARRRVALPGRRRAQSGNFSLPPVALGKAGGAAPAWSPRRGRGSQL